MKGKAKALNFTHQQVLDALNYNPSTGVFVWKISPAKNVKIGDVAGGDGKGNGYRYVRLYGEDVTAARLAVFYITGEWARGRIRFKNGNIADCRFENLIISRTIEGNFDHKRRQDRIYYHKAYRREGANSIRDRFLLKKFGISLEQYNQMHSEQNGVCKICKQPETHKRNGVLKALAVDHCHKTGKVRGLLCCDCNTGIGKLKDSIDVLLSAVQYLKN